jgi:hypothetical protein
LIWQGWCSDRIDTGEGRPDTLLFFESDQSKHIRQVGQRLFGKSEGVIKTLACDSTEDDLIVILVDSASNIHRMETGFISDFVEKREIKKTIGWIRDNIRAAGRRSGSGLYLLSHDGTVYCTNTDTWELKAVLSPSEPFQMMSVGGGLQGPILLADSKSDIFSCRLENG